MKCICLGDSLTFGYGVDREKRWIELLKKSFNGEIINKGLNGDTTAGMLSRSYTDIIKKAPTHAIIMGGTNDFIAERTSKYVFDNIALLLQECKSNNIIPIVSIQPFIYTPMAKVHWAENIDYENINSKIEEYRNSMLLSSSDTNIICADLFKAFKELTPIDSDISSFFIDGLHPSPKGHSIIAERLLECFMAL